MTAGTMLMILCAEERVDRSRLPGGDRIAGRARTLRGSPSRKGRRAMVPSPGTNAQTGVVKASDSVERRPVAAGRATEIQVLLGEDDGAPHFAMRRFIMGEGGGMPLHTNRVEHEQYVLRGRARIAVAGTVHEVASGDVLYIPAGTPHSYEVVEGPFEFLCMVPNQPDHIQLLDE